MKDQIVDFADPSEHQIEISQQRKIGDYQDLKRELKGLKNPHCTNSY